MKTFTLILFLTAALASYASPQMPIGEKIGQLTHSYLGAPYKLSPLGEGQGKDPDPLIRFDLFDCTTFVETVGAQVIAESENHYAILEKLNQIRYSNGKPNFLTRNHFISLDWLPQNIQKGIVQDLSAQLYPEIFKTIYTRIDKESWYKHNFKISHSEPVKEASLDIILIDDLLKDLDLLKKIPQGSIVSIIINNPDLKNKIGTDLDVVHMGFAIWKNDQLYFRHAKNVKFGVIEEPFTSMLQSSLKVDRYALHISAFKKKN